MYYGDGAGAFKDADGIGTSLQQTLAMVVGDLNNDEDQGYRKIRLKCEGTW